jgi:hypothetical protein
LHFYNNLYILWRHLKMALKAEGNIGQEHTMVLRSMRAYSANL